MFDIQSEENRQAAMALNVDLQVNYNKNMSFFKTRDKALYDFYSRFKPEKMSLKLTEEGYVNLYNLETGGFVYPYDPAKYAQEQATDFIKEQPYISLNLLIPDNNRDDYPFTRYLNQVESRFINYPQQRYNKVDEIDQVFMYGGGLFLHLEHLLNGIDVKRLCIFEPNSDAFYCSMHLIDWSEIYRYFDRDGYNLQLYIIDSNANNLLKISSYIHSIGPHRFARIYKYFHYQNDEINHIYNMTSSYLQSSIGAVGFFEDEIIGLAHTLENLKNKVPYADTDLSKKCNYDETPVYIVGNGPSLDNEIEFLKSNKDHFILFSCGSALGALLKCGIRPDVHIEQERMLLVKDWILDAGSLEEIKSIPFIGLNPCHPYVFNLFDSAYMVMKPADLGEDLFREMDLEYVLANNALPVVGNFALSVAMLMGFKNIYFVGIDCGMIDADHHHSKESGYYEIDTEEMNVVKDDLLASGTTLVKGNFREYVVTTPVYNFSKINLEQLLSLYKPNCHNLSDGAFIEGATPLKSSDVVFKILPKNKTQILNERLKLVFNGDEVVEEEMESQIKKMTRLVLEFIRFVKEKYSYDLLEYSVVLVTLDEVQKIIAASEILSRTSYRIIHGTIKGASYRLAYARSHLNEKDYSVFLLDYLRATEELLDKMEYQIKNSLHNYDKF